MTTLMAIETLGQLIKRLRDEKGISQNRLAKITGIDRSYLNQLENDKAGGITLKTARLLAAGLGYEPSVFLSADQTPVKLPPMPINALWEELINRYHALEVVQLPVIGRSSAGTFEMREQEPIGYIEVTKGKLGKDLDPKKLYALEVQGDSLEGDNIHDGDYAVIEKDALFIDGKIYVVKVDNQVCLKHVNKENDRLVLRSANSHYADVEVKEADLQGRVIMSQSQRYH